MAIKDGGSAFPIIDVHQPWNHSTHERDGVQTVVDSYGMSLRDYFAAHAITAVVAFEDRALSQDDPLPVDVIARNAYQLADAMLAARLVIKEP